MALEKRLVDGHVLDCHDALFAAAFEDAVNQEKGITVGQNGHDLPYVQYPCRFLFGILVFHGRSANYRAFEVVTGVADPRGKKRGTASAVP
jgi:hypothetical protein